MVGLLLPCSTLTFSQWIERLIAERFGTPTALAHRLGMRLTPFQRGVESGTFNIVNLLKLASIAGEHPSTVLRLAGKGDVADLIERLYDVSGEPLTESQREVLDLWAHVRDERKVHLLDVLRVYRNAELDVHTAKDPGRSGSLSHRTNSTTHTTSRGRRRSTDVADEP